MRLWPFLSLACLSGLAVPSAQAECDCRIGLGIVETAYVGSYDHVLRDLLTGSTVSNSGGSADFQSLLDIILPDGVPPDDLEIGFHPEAGFAVTFGADTQILAYPVVIESVLLHDTTRISALAPSGFGILTDPTRLDISVRLMAGGMTASLPIAGGQIRGLDWAFSLGAGGMLYVGHTSSRVRSELLEIDLDETMIRLTPVATAALSLSPARTGPGRAGFDLQVSVFPTDNFFSGIARARFSIPF